MGNNKILFIDDDTSFGNILTSSLKYFGYEVDYMSDFLSIESVIKEVKPSLLLLDVKVGGNDGIEKAGEIIKLFPELPVIMISAHASTENIVKALENGCLTLLDKATSIEVIYAYIKRFATPFDKMIELGNFSFVFNTRQIINNIDNSSITISETEAKVLYLLATNKNKIVSRDDIFNKLSCISNFTPQKLSNSISNLRNYFSSCPSVSISSMKGKGYAVSIPDEDGDDGDDYDDDFVEDLYNMSLSQNVL
ncbi:MAG: response regulator transcription factor [Rikenellaceae bacterium]